MKAEEIKNIENAVEEVSGALKNFVLSEHEDHTYGSEGEYTSKSLKAGIRGHLNHIRALVKAHNKFADISSYRERNQIVNILIGIKDNFSSEEYDEAANSFNELKTIIRSYRAWGSRESRNVIEERVNKLIEMESELEERIEKAQRHVEEALSIKSEADNIYNSLQGARQVVDDLTKRTEDIANKLSQAEEFQVNAEVSKNKIQEILDAAKAGHIDISSIDQKLKALHSRAEEYENELTSHLKKVKELINEAKNALGYKIAEGISAAFNERYNEGKQEKKSWRWWLVGALSFISSAFLIGILWPSSSDDASITMIISRITLMLTSLSGAWFCAAQYVKDKNILEDYGYKSVLAKSMVGFLDQFKNEERELYLKTVLHEIHRDPLRKRHDLDVSSVQSVARKLQKDRGKSPTDAGPSEGT